MRVPFPLRARRTAPDELDRRVRAAMARMELTPLADRKPSQLTGGRQQRVALARALVRNPAVYLMDEPLSNLDAQLRLQTRAELRRLQQELRAWSASSVRPSRDLTRSSGWNVPRRVASGRTGLTAGKSWAYVASDS